MAHVVWKFPLQWWASAVEMPRGARILSAGEAPDGVLCVWALCDPDAPRESRCVVALNTGAGSPSQGEFIGTVRMRASGIVWHLFEGRE